MHDERTRPGPAQAGVGMIGLIASLAVLAVLAVVAVTALGGQTTGISGLPTLPRPSSGSGAKDSGGSPTTSPGPGALIAGAGDIVAQQNLNAALSLADQVALTSGGYGDVDAADLSAADARGLFTSGPSMGTGQINVDGAGGTDGGVALTVRSASGACWFVWRSSSATWYGVGVSAPRPSCAAPALPGPPAAGSYDGVEWQSGAFPSAAAP